MKIPVPPSNRPAHRVARTGFGLGIAVLAGCSAITPRTSSAPTGTISGAPAPPAARGAEPPPPAVLSARESCAQRGAAACYALGLSLSDDEEDAQDAFHLACALGDSRGCRFELAVDSQFHPLAVYGSLVALACRRGFVSACKELYDSPLWFMRVLELETEGPRIRYVKQDIALEPAPGQPAFHARAIPGAKLLVMSERDGRATAVLAGFRPAIADIDEVRTHIPLPRVVVPSVALSDQAIPLSASDIFGIRTRDHDRLILDRPNGRALAATTCGDVYVLEDADGVQRIAQMRDGVLLEGYADKPITANWGEYTCPAGFTGEGPFAVDGTPVEATETTPLLDRAWHAGLETYWIETTGDTATCQSYTLRGGQMVGRWSPRDADGNTRRGFYTVQHERGDRHVALSYGWDDRDARGHVRTGYVHCDAAFEVVAVNDDAIVLVPSDSRHEATEYIAQYAQRWWLSSSACEAALAADPRVPLSAIHAGARPTVASTQVVSFQGC